MKPNPRLPTALIATPDPDTAFQLRKNLQLSFQLIERDDIASAEESLTYTSPDLVIVDSKDLDEAALFSALSRLRRTLGKKKVPVLLITNNLKKKFAQEALRSGASDFINRPLDEDEIEQRITVAFQSFEKTQDIATIAKRATPSFTESSPSLAHRKILNDQAIKELAKARENGGHISLIFVEGGTADELGPVLQDTVRRNDILIPQGPGKYLLMLPKTSERAAELIADTVRENVFERLPRLTLSIGLITWDSSLPSHGSAAEEFDHLIKTASRAAEKAKKARS